MRERTALGMVPALEGFDMLHQLLSVLALEAPQRYVAEAWGLPGPQTLPERLRRSFEEFQPYRPTRSVVAARAPNR
jgi:hypothetical protein